jgi:DNA polymerase-3 subunit epsilon
VRSSLERKLTVGVVVLFLVPTVVVGAILLVLYRRGALESPATLAVVVTAGFVTMMAYLTVVAHGIGRVLVRRLREIQLGTELMATVNPDHRLQVRTGDELESLAGEINRMADRVRDARLGLEAEVARATRLLEVERGKLSAVLESLGEGVAVATLEGRVILANPAAHELLRAGGAGLLGRSLFDLVDRETVAHFLDRLRAGEGSAERFSLRVAGTAILEAVMTPFADAEGQATGFVLVLRDVTRPARSDEERQQRLTETLRALRGPLASIRSLSESLVADPRAAPVRRLLEAIHADAVRLSAVLAAAAGPERLRLAPAPRHFEEVDVPGLCAMAVRRLRGAGDGVEVDAPELPRLRTDVAALSAALAHLLDALRAPGAPGARVWLRARSRGRVLQLDAGGAGDAVAADLEAELDRPVAVAGGERATVREIARVHTGEVWAYAGAGSRGFRLTLPFQEPPAAPAGVSPAPALVGAGLVSGSGPGGGAARPDFYDFSLLDAMERHVRPADRDLALDELTCAVFDTETTGLDPDGGDRVVSLAAVRVRQGRVRRGEVFDALVNPGRPIPSASVRFHGITDEMVAEAPPVDVVLPAFLRFAGGAVLVGHQVWFDLRFLAMAAARLGLPPLTSDHAVLDTLALSEIVHGPLDDHDLDAVARRLGVEVRARHSALGDALATAEVFARLVPLLRKRGIRTLGEALDAAGRASRAGSRLG